MHRFLARHRQHVCKTEQRELQRTWGRNQWAESRNSQAASAGVRSLPESVFWVPREGTYRLLIAVKHVLFGEEPHAVH